MQTILLTIHTLIALAPVGLVLLQRSEGGGLGIGGGGAGGGFMTARGTANLWTKATAALATCFLTSIGLAILAGAGSKTTSIVDEVPQRQQRKARQLSRQCQQDNKMCDNQAQDIDFTFQERCQ